MSKHVAIYKRVSSKGQSHASQEPDLERWAAAQVEPVVTYSDFFTGKVMERPGWTELENAIYTGHVSSVVVWRLDRLGRTAKGLTALFEELCRLKVNLISLKDALDLSTPAGRLMANVLASVAQYDMETRYENQRAGIDAALAAGKRWGGSEPGKRKKVTPDKERIIKQLHREEVPITRIARAVELSRPTVYDVLASLEATC